MLLYCIVVNLLRYLLQLKKFNHKKIDIDYSLQIIIYFKIGQDGQTQLPSDTAFADKLKVSYKFEYYEKIPPEELKNKSVFIAGSFNNWKERIPMTFDPENQRFEVTIDLQPAKYQFKFIVNAEWKCCDLYQKINDDSGNVNNFVQILYADDGQQENSNFQQLKQLENIFTTELPQNPHQIWNGFPTDLPKQVTKTPLNNYDIRKEYEPSVLLPLPDHVVLTHFFKQKKKNNMKICASTNRYRQKYITIILYEADRLLKILKLNEYSLLFQITEDSIPELEEIQQDINEQFIDIQQLPQGEITQYDDSYNDNYYKAMELRKQAINLQNTEFEQSIKYITESILLQPMSQLFLVTRAIILYNNFEYKAAIKDIECALQRNNNQGSFNSYKYGALCYYELHQYEKCLKYAQLALQLQTDQQVQQLLQQCKQKIEQNQIQQKEQENRQKEQMQQWQKENQNNQQQNKFNNQYDWLNNLTKIAQNLNQDSIKQLESNEVIKNIVNDEQFAQKINQIAANPNAMLNYQNDQEFMKTFIMLINQFK